MATMDDETTPQIDQQQQQEWTKIKTRHRRRRRSKLESKGQQTSQSGEVEEVVGRTSTKTVEELVREYGVLRERFYGSRCCGEVRRVLREEVFVDVEGGFGSLEEGEEKAKEEEEVEKNEKGEDVKDEKDVEESDVIKEEEEEGGEKKDGKESNKKKKRQKTRISKAICLGLGSFDPEDGGWESKKRAWTQLFAFQLLIEELSPTTPIKILLQEPLLTPQETTFLTTLNTNPYHPITVVPTPKAFEAVDAETLLFGVHLYRPVYEAALAGSQLPAVFVGTGWDVWDGALMKGGHDAGGEKGPKALRAMHGRYRRVEFPQDEGTTFSSTSIYWRPPGMDPSVEP